jgi:hypothetical protein
MEGLMMVKNFLKVYGTRKRGHRERWIVNGNGVYKEVRRDKKGRFVSAKKWSPKKPISKEVYDETKPLLVEYRTGKDALIKAREAAKDWEWITPMRVKS